MAEDGDTPCECCRNLWPAEALERGICPDCQEKPAELAEHFKSRRPGLLDKA